MYFDNDTTKRINEKADERSSYGIMLNGEYVAEKIGGLCICKMTDIPKLIKKLQVIQETIKAETGLNL